MKIERLSNGSAEYVTVDGDMVDQVAEAYYGTHLRTTELIYEANQNLSRRAMTMPAGVRITLPPYVRPSPPGQIKLWD